MSTIVTYQAIYRIGPVKVSKGHAGMQSRKVNETFTLNIDDPLERALRDRLQKLGAILPINEPDLPIVQGQVDEPAPVVVEVSEPPEYSEPIEGITPEHIPESTETDYVPGSGVQTKPLDEPIDTLIDILTPEIVDTLERSGVKTIRDLERREDNALRNIGGIGAKRLKNLREAYNERKVEEMKADGAVSHD